MANSERLVYEIHTVGGETVRIRAAGYSVKNGQIVFKDEAEPGKYVIFQHGVCYIKISAEVGAASGGIDPPRASRYRR